MCIIDEMMRRSAAILRRETKPLTFELCSVSSTGLCCVRPFINGLNRSFSTTNACLFFMRSREHNTTLGVCEFRAIFILHSSRAVSMGTFVLSYSRTRSCVCIYMPALPCISVLCVHAPPPPFPSPARDCRAAAAVHASTTVSARIAHLPLAHSGARAVWSDSKRTLPPTDPPPRDETRAPGCVDPKAASPYLFYFIFHPLVAIMPRAERLHQPGCGSYARLLFCREGFYRISS